MLQSLVPVENREGDYNFVHGVFFKVDYSYQHFTNINKIKTMFYYSLRWTCQSLSCLVLTFCALWETKWTRWRTSTWPSLWWAHTSATIRPTLATLPPPPLLTPRPFPRTSSRSISSMQNRMFTQNCIRWIRIKLPRCTASFDRSHW